MAAMQAEAGVPDVAGGVGAPTVIPGPAFDVAVLRESVGDDAAILREVVACFDEVASAIRASARISSAAADCASRITRVNTSFASPYRPMRSSAAP